jgi:bacillopeptidase F
MKESMFLVVLTVGILIILVIWGIPAFIRLTGVWGEMRSGKSNGIQDSIAPFTPQLNINYDATSSATVRLAGNSEAGSTVSLYIDENKIAEAKTNDSGEFSFDEVRLSEGDNHLSVQARDDADNQSQRSKPINIIYDHTPPDLSISSPNDNQEFYGDSEKVVKITGTTETGADVYVNDNFTTVDSKGNFERRLALQDGDNQIEIRAVDQAGNETKKSLHLVFKK